jgi:hypothetical protein
VHTGPDDSQPGTVALNEKYALERTPDFTHGGVDYGEFMRFLDVQLCPSGYLEIGTHQGYSTTKLSCDAICIDPNFVVEQNIINTRSRMFLFQMLSDDFFRECDPRSLIHNIDIGFLDGLHHFEALLKDFINFERCSHPGSIALLHDCLPLNVRMTGRNHQPGPETEPAETRSFWTGDVWRILPILREFRPDLKVTMLDCPPTGLIVCRGLDNRSDVLTFAYERLIARYSSIYLDAFGIDKLWGCFPLLSSRKIVSDPRVFCEYFRLRR